MSGYFRLVLLMMCAAEITGRPHLWRSKSTSKLGKSKSVRERGETSNSNENANDPYYEEMLARVNYMRTEKFWLTPKREGELNALLANMLPENMAQTVFILDEMIKNCIADQDRFLKTGTMMTGILKNINKESEDAKIVNGIMTRMSDEMGYVDELDYVTLTEIYDNLYANHLNKIIPQMPNLDSARRDGITIVAEEIWDRNYIPSAIEDELDETLDFLQISTNDEDDSIKYAENAVSGQSSSQDGSLSSTPQAEKVSEPPASPKENVSTPPPPPPPPSPPPQTSQPRQPQSPQPPPPHVDSDEKCSICIDNVGTLVVKTLPCGHNFHEFCICKWYNEHVKEKPVCPVCRKVFNCDARVTLPSWMYGLAPRSYPTKPMMYQEEYDKIAALRQKIAKKINPGFLMRQLFENRYI